MSRRIAYAVAIVITTCPAFTAPASADRECFESTCRMAEVIRPQTIADQVPRSAPTLSPSRPAQVAEKAAPRPVAPKDRAARDSNEPIKIVGRRFPAAEAPAYAPPPYPAQPGAGVVVVVPGVQYGADGVALAEGRQSAAWQLCQSVPGDSRCTPYNYQPYGPYGYRPLGSYRPQRSAPLPVYVPGAKIINID